MTVIERKAVEVLARGEWPDQPKHGTWRAECMVAWLKDAGIELVDATTTQGAVEALRELLAALDDTLGPVPSDGEWPAIVQARRALRELEQPGALTPPRTDQPKEDR